jgi:hypothetical protein
MGATIEAVAIGREIPPFQRATGFANWSRFAAVNDEFVAIHMDDEAGRAAGYPTAFGMGNLQWSYLHNMLRDWIGNSGDIVRVACRFVAANTRGMTVVARGRVTGTRDADGHQEVDLDVWVEDADSSTSLAVGTATVRLDPSGAQHVRT